MNESDTISSGVLDDNGFLYTVAGGKASIVRFPESIKDLRDVPDKVGGYPVTAISTAAFNWPDPPPPVYKDGEGEYVAPDGVVFDANQTVIKSIPCDLEELIVPASVRDIDQSVPNSMLLKSIRVEEGNGQFSSVNGVLFNADKSELLAVPGGMTGECWIPASVRIFCKDACLFSPKVTDFNVDPDNDVFRSVDGVVYTRDLSELYMIPDGYTGRLTIPHGVRRIQFGHFRSPLCLTEILIPASVCEIVASSNEFWAYDLSSIEVHPDNLYYRSEDGVLFSKDRTRLIWCPPGKTGVFVIPKDVVALDDYAFASCRKLERIDVPHQFQLSEDSVFYSCEEKVRVQHVPDRSRGDYDYGWLGCLEASQGQCYFRAGQFRKEVMLAGVADSVSGDFIIPDTIDGRRVERIMRHAFGFVPNLTSVTIPSAVTRIDDFAFYACDNLSEISVDADNSVFSSYDGCLYDKGQTRLIRCPCGKEGELKMPASVLEIDGNALSECVKLSAFDVSVENVTFASYYGALFDKELTTLIRVPPRMSGVFSIPVSVAQIYDAAFEGCDMITDVRAPARKTKKDLSFCSSYLVFVKLRQDSLKCQSMY